MDVSYQYIQNVRIILGRYSMKLWLHSKSDRDAVVCILFDNGYVIRKIERPNEKYPLTMVDYGIEIVDAPDKSGDNLPCHFNKSEYEILDIPDTGEYVVRVNAAKRSSLNTDNNIDGAE